MLLWLRYVLGLVCLGLIVLDYWATAALAGIVGGVFVTLVWAGANALQSVEYWRGTCPRWMFRLFGEPRDQETSKISAHSSYIITKTMAVIFGVTGTVGFIIAGIEGTCHIILAILFPVTLILGVGLSELHFRHRYTRITDWSKSYRKTVG